MLLGAYDGGLDISKDFKQFRPSYDELDSYYDFLEKIWMLVLNKCPGFKPILEGRKKPGDIRKCMDSEGRQVLDESGLPIPGGNVFARPIGQFIIADVIKLAGIQGKSIENVIEAIMNNISMNIDNSPWVRVIWNPSMQRIKGTKSERALLVSIISHSLGLRIKPKVRDLKQKYRDLIEDPKASLLPPIEWSGNQDRNNESEEFLNN